jgi:hypothetical protein
VSKNPTVFELNSIFYVAFLMDRSLVEGIGWLKTRRQDLVGWRPAQRYGDPVWKVGRYKPCYLFYQSIQSTILALIYEGVAKGGFWFPWETKSIPRQTVMYGGKSIPIGLYTQNLKTLAIVAKDWIGLFVARVNKLSNTAVNKLSNAARVTTFKHRGK